MKTHIYCISVLTIYFVQTANIPVLMKQLSNRCGSDLPHRNTTLIVHVVGAMLEEMQTDMVVSMVVWDLVQEMLKVRGL